MNATMGEIDELEDLVFLPELEVKSHRGRRPQQSHCKRGHALTPENRRIYKYNGRIFRQCIACEKARRDEAHK